METISFFLTFLGAMFALFFALMTGQAVLKNPEGNEKMKKIAGFIRIGANAYQIFKEKSF